MTLEQQIYNSAIKQARTERSAVAATTRAMSLIREAYEKTLDPTAQASLFTAYQYLSGEKLLVEMHEETEREILLGAA